MIKLSQGFLSTGVGCPQLKISVPSTVYQYFWGGGFHNYVYKVGIV